jgi:hypothetical protein
MTFDSRPAMLRVLALREARKAVELRLQRQGLREAPRFQEAQAYFDAHRDRLLEETARKYARILPREPHN